MCLLDSLVVRHPLLVGQLQHETDSHPICLLTIHAQLQLDCDFSEALFQVPSHVNIDDSTTLQSRITHPAAKCTMFSLSRNCSPDKVP